MAAPKRRHAQPWSQSEITQLKVLSRKGKTRPEIARILKRTLNSVDRKAKRLKVRSVRYHPR